LIDLNELTGAGRDSSSLDEQIKDLRMQFKFNSTARSFTESPNLPVGEFFIQHLHAQFTHYPHELHDFNADILIDENNFNVIDFTGMIDQSDFHFTGNLKNYDLWFSDNPSGTTILDFNLNSSLLQLDDLFAYRGENYVPEDYRHEEISNLKLHGVTKLDFDGTFSNCRTTIDQVEAGLKIHPMRFKQFRGEIYYDKSRLEVSDMSGILGNSDFSISMSYNFESGSSAEPHSFTLNSDRLDFDQLFAYNPPPADQQMTPEAHEAGFNIFELPFSNMRFDFNVNHLNYHRILIDDFNIKGRMQEDHFIYLDTMAFKAAGGNIRLKGYFNGSDPKAIYFSPDLHVENVDLDKLMFKFENFGQDHLVSENLHGNLSGTISGRIHMHADMVPIIDDSELHLNFSVINGSLNNYAVFNSLSDYFVDKNLNHVRFDTLTNSLDMKDGKLHIPAMNINSSLGFFEISGTQEIDLSMEYYLRLPVKLVTRAAAHKLFGAKDTDTSGQVDE
ncbi:MAG: AsmA-like C-terminal region-containing protein, partial [Cyclobacteriaceae bacterium]